ncbi:MAG TPA: methylamine utilization protein MauD, partial [Acidimicrobiaceae bacterium]|nr:methylamine utilization protein MauD [Acidimicrobiaceae bacterium]
VAFTTLIVGRLLAGHREACGCFGNWSKRPLSWRDLARNGTLIALGAVAALG